MTEWSAQDITALVVAVTALVSAIAGGVVAIIQVLRVGAKVDENTVITKETQAKVDSIHAAVAEPTKPAA
jgi:hypothetical protein